MDEKLKFTEVKIAQLGLLYCVSFLPVISRWLWVPGNSVASPGTLVASLRYVTLCV